MKKSFVYVRYIHSLDTGTIYSLMGSVTNSRIALQIINHERTFAEHMAQMYSLLQITNLDYTSQHYLIIDCLYTFTLKIHLPKI